MSYQGTVKTYNPAKGFGFIDCQGTDVFVHIKDCQGNPPQTGDVMTFDAVENPGKPGSMKASNATGGTGQPQQAGGMTGQPQMGQMIQMGGAPPAVGTGTCQAICKRFNSEKAWGFLDYQGVDVFVHAKDCIGNPPQEGDVMTFDVIDNPGKPGSMKATNVTGGTGMPNQGFGKGFAKGGGGGGFSMPVPVQGTGAFQGVVKNFSSEKGWGFIEAEGQDVFLHVKDCQGNPPQQGDILTFDVEASPMKPGQMKAINVTGGTGCKGGGKGGDSWGGAGYGPIVIGGGWGGGAGKGGDSWGATPYGKGAKGGDSWGAKGGW